MMSQPKERQNNRKNNDGKNKKELIQKGVSHSEPLKIGLRRKGLPG
jgi:hypothetical protein